MADEQHEFLTVAEVAEELRVSERTVQRLMKAGKLTHCSMTGNGGCVRITRQSVEGHKGQMLEQGRINSLLKGQA